MSIAPAVGIPPLVSRAAGVEFFLNATLGHYPKFTIHTEKLSAAPKDRVNRQNLYSIGSAPGRA